MQSETAKTRLLVLVLANLGLLLFGNTAVAQQSIEDNIRPAGQVCLAGQSCVGKHRWYRICSTAQHLQPRLRQRPPLR